jgi:hypothetical protein
MRDVAERENQKMGLTLSRREAGDEIPRDHPAG